MLNFKLTILVCFSIFLNINFCPAQKLSKNERKEFQEKCKQLAQTFCGYIEELTEENSNSKNMTIDQFYNSEVCQFTINQMRQFFSEENLKTNRIIGYTPNGRPPVQYTSIEKYIRMLLNQRKRYRTVNYNFSAFIVTELIERIDQNGKIYYEGKVNFKQNYMASKKYKGNAEVGWDVFHEDFKSLTFKIEHIKTRDGKYFAITFHKLEVDLQSY